MPPLKSMLAHYGMDDEGRARRKAFLRLEESDEALLRALRDQVILRSHDFIEKFYQHLMRFEETRELLLAEPRRLERLKEIQRQYFIRLVEGDYDAAYFEERLRVGHAHERVGLDPQWYLGAFGLYIQLNLPLIFEIYEGNLAKAIATLGALVKIVFLDLGLAIDTYIGASMAAMDEAKSYLERVLSSISDGLLVTDAEGTVRDVNPALLSLTGFDREELIGKPATILSGDTDSTGFRERLAHLARVGTSQQDRTLRCRSGEMVSVALSISAIRDKQGQLLGFVSVLRDMRERMQLLNALEESNRYLELVLSSISDGIVVISPAGIIQQVNPEILKMTKYKREELLGQSVGLLWKEETEEIRQVRHRHTAETGSWHDDRWLHCKDGAPIPVAFSGSAIRDRFGKLLGFVAVARDMSEHNRLVGALEAAKATLEQRVEERSRELRNAQIKLFQSEKLSAIGQLAAGIAHEIGTPLNIISGRAEYLLSELGDDPRAQNLKVIIGQIDRISGLIEQLLDFARDRTEELGPVRLTRCLDSLLPLLDSRLRKQGVTVDLAIGGLPEIHGNCNRLQQIFLNLIVNAADAIRSARPAGGGVISISGEAQGEEVLVDVRDDGCGIPASNLARIFDPFFTTKPVGQGTGLGLSVTYGLVEEMGGSIRAQSEPGQGSVFSLRFRRARSSAG
jgi:PAS domain S-box-containing protein